MTARHNMLQFIAIGDHKLMHKLNKWPAPKWVRLWAIAATRAGDGWLWGFVGLFILLFGGADRLVALASAGSAALAGIGIFVLTKKLQAASVRAKLNLIVGPSFCRLIDFLFPPATPSPLSQWLLRLVNFIPLCFRLCCFALSA